MALTAEQELILEQIAQAQIAEAAKQPLRDALATAQLELDNFYVRAENARQEAIALVNLQMADEHYALLGAVETARQALED